MGCLRPPFPKYGHITPIKKAYAIGEQLWYKCLPGRRPYPEADIVCLGRNYWSVPEVKCVTEESCKTKTVCGKVLPGRSCQCEAKFCAQYPHQCCSDFKEYCKYLPTLYLGRIQKGSMINSPLKKFIAATA